MQVGDRKSEADLGVVENKIKFNMLNLNIKAE
jgi:hypothetical protein